MILFFRTPSKSVIAVESNHQLTPDESNKLCWLFGEAVMESEENLKGCFVGPRRVTLVPLLALVQVFAEGRVGDMEVGSNLLCRGPVFGPFDDLVQVGEDMGLVFTFCHSLPPAFLKNWLLFHRSKGSFFFRPEGRMFFHSGVHACVGGPSHPHHPPIPPFLSLSPWSGGDHFRGLTKKIRDPRP